MRLPIKLLLTFSCSEIHVGYIIPLFLSVDILSFSTKLITLLSRVSSIRPSFPETIATVPVRESFPLNALEVISHARETREALAVVSYLSM